MPTEFEGLVLLALGVVVGLLLAAALKPLEGGSRD